MTREDGYEALVARGEIRDGGIGYMLRRLVAQRAQSAREGMELIGQLVERFGYADSGRTYAVADPQEAWVVEVVRGRRWVAQRVPDDAVVILPARHVIGEVDLADRANFRASPDLVSYATQRGWFDPAGGRPFNFRLAYQAPERTTPDGRQFRGQEVVTGKPGHWPPEEPLPFAVRPHKRLSRGRRGGGAARSRRSGRHVQQDDPRGGRVPASARHATRNRLRLLAHDRPARHQRPDALARRGDGNARDLRPAGATPQQLLSLEHHFQPSPDIFQPDNSRAWWKFKRLAQVVDGSYAARIGTVQKSWSAMEQRLLQEQPQIEAEALALWPTDPAAARALLTSFCSERSLEACAEADRLAETLTRD